MGDEARGGAVAPVRRAADDVDGLRRGGHAGALHVVEARREEVRGGVAARR